MWFTHTVTRHRIRDVYLALRGGMPASIVTAFVATTFLGMLVIVRFLIFIADVTARDALPRYLFITAGILLNIVAVHLLAAILLRGRWRWSRILITVLGGVALANDWVVFEPISFADAAVAVVAIITVWLPSARRYMPTGPLLSSSFPVRTGPRRARDGFAQWHHVNRRTEPGTPSSKISRRALTDSELRVMRTLVDLVPSLDLSDAELGALRAEPMADGGMGSLRFWRDGGDPRMGSQGSHLMFTDADGTPVSATLVLDREGNVHELDMWKVDSSPLLRIPETFNESFEVTVDTHFTLPPSPPGNIVRHAPC